MILSAIVNQFRLYKLNKVDKFVMSYGGLRGAVAFALVLLISKEHVKLQPMLVTTTIAVIYFTVFFQVSLRCLSRFRVYLRLYNQEQKQTLIFYNTYSKTYHQNI